jgi:hypothetical protein
MLMMGPSQWSPHLHQRQHRSREEDRDSQRRTSWHEFTHLMKVRNCSRIADLPLTIWTPNFGLRDAIGGNPIEAAAFRHIKPQLPHVIGGLSDSM